MFEGSKKVNVLIIVLVAEDNEYKDCPERIRPF